MKALVVDDDRVLADVVAFTLRREGFQVVQAFDGKAALQVWAQDEPDLIVLDVNLPKLDGFSVCQQIRVQADTPILLLTVRNEEDDIIQGLELGADDYITKPFSPRQLVARVHAILRRSSKMPAATNRFAGPLTLDPGRREMWVAKGEPVSLTPLECRLLDYLMLNTGHVLTYEAIINQVWGASGADRDMVRQLTRRLRAKLVSACQGQAVVDSDEFPVYIETVPGLGYGLAVANLSG